MTNDTNDKGVSYHHFVILRFSTNDETVGADLCVCPETSTSASGRTRRSAPTASLSNRSTLGVMGTQNDI